MASGGITINKHFKGVAPIETDLDGIANYANSRPTGKHNTFFQDNMNAPNFTIRSTYPITIDDDPANLKMLANNELMM